MLVCSHGKQWEIRNILLEIQKQLMYLSILMMHVCGKLIFANGDLNSFSRMYVWESAQIAGSSLTRGTVLCS